MRHAVQIHVKFELQLVGNVRLIRLEAHAHNGASDDGFRSMRHVRRSQPAAQLLWLLHHIITRCLILYDVMIHRKDMVLN
jgi:hypothetical protein